jgi:methylase of polypeptide subunit release factors
VTRVGEVFAQVGYTVEGVRELLGPVAGGALARDEIVPALRAARGPGLGALVRLFWLQVPVAVRDLPPGLPSELAALGLAAESAGEVRALLRVVPLEPADGYAVSDLKVRPGDGTRLAPDHVVGTGGASSNLAQLVVHRAVDNSLDLGTGSGVQAVHLARRSARVTATDVNPRALKLARLSCLLSGVPVPELLEGSLFEPVAGRRFDLIVSNPPFVVAPPSGLLTYRSSGFPGDEICRRLVVEAPGHLAEDGWCQLLANWLHVSGEPWEERLAAWLPGSDCDAWVVQRDVQDPAEYAELWLRDSCEAGTPEYRARYEAWLDYFEERKVTGIGFGWITLHRSGGSTVRIEDLRHQVDQPVGAYVEDVMTGLRTAERLAGDGPAGLARGGAAAHPAGGAGLAEARGGDGGPAGVNLDRLVLRTAGGVVQEQIGAPGAPDPERIVLRRPDRLRRAAGVGTVEAALAGVCDGTLPLGPLLEAISELMGLPLDDVRAHAAAVLPELIADGFFTVA